MSKNEDFTKPLHFDHLLVELYQGRNDFNKLKIIYKYVISNKYNYCLVELFTLINCCKGYMVNNNLEKKEGLNFTINEMETHKP